MIVIMYLAAIVAANLIVAAYGPAVSVLTAFAFIGLNITARDRLHDQWQGRHLLAKMAGLVLTGSAISYLINQDAASIAVASAVAFGASESTDAVMYAGLRKHPWFARTNGSNVVSAAVDSFIFPLLAFGGIMPTIVLGQFLAKTFGGAIWSVALKPRRTKVPHAALFVFALLLGVASPANAQIANVSVGRIVVGDFTDEVAELFVATPAVAGLRISAIASAPLSDLSATPTWIAQLSADPWRYLGFDVGMVDTPFDRARLTAGFHSFHAVGPAVLTVIHSYQPHAESWTTIAKIGVTKFWR